MSGGHNNMVFDDEYNLLGVIDWEAAYAGPWELFGEFPVSTPL
jgi:aminoglycoside phosphotransferase (APT) family kinase protein